ncbi:MAG: pyrroline-5-carboxylate reductase [Gammaproteobacteria bacterium]
MMNNATIAFIGAGRMASSLIGGLIANGWPAEKIWVANPHTEQLEVLEKKLNIHTTLDNPTAVSKADVVIVAVKPSVVPEIMHELAEVIRQKGCLVISVAAGIPLAKYAEWLGKTVPVVRCMPNTPALIQAGASGLFANDQVEEVHKSLAESIIRAVGVVTWVPKEIHMEIVTALSGSGPAYFFLMMEALENTAREQGLPADVAHLLTVQTALGAARLALESSHDLVTLRQQVTSPGGTTEQGVAALEKGGIRELMARAVQAARIRAEELAADS